jgi:hypothetical protein
LRRSKLQKANGKKADAEICHLQLAMQGAKAPVVRFATCLFATCPLLNETCQLPFAPCFETKQMAKGKWQKSWC